MKFSMDKFTLEEPRPQQIDIINDILHAMDQGYRNIILEAGTGVGKSAIATTIANYVDDSYIITMTNQLLQQYLYDFKDMVSEIKGKDNYPCRFSPEVKGKCMIDEVNKKRFDEYNKQLSLYKTNPNTYPKPPKPTLDKNCGNKCPFIKALNEAKESDNIITNYDFLYYAGNFANILKKRKLLILDETHNLEQKIMNLTIKTLNRKTIWQTYKIDIFDGIINEGMTLEKIKKPDYWITLCNKIISTIQRLLQEYISDLEKEFFKHIIHRTQIDEFEFKQLLNEDKLVKKYKKTISKYDELINVLKTNEWIIELPTKKEILADETYLTQNKEAGLTAEFKPLTVNEYTDSLLHFGNVRLFMTGTLGSKDMFCKWIGIDPKETYHIYVKSPFPVENRPIYRCYSGNMSSGAWRNDNHLIKLHDILEEHKNEKGVIHVSSNEQAWWIRNELKEYVYRKLRVASGKKREEVIEEFEDDPKNMVLISPSVKDGVDFKGDKCRFQIIYKMPFPMLKGEQVNRRKNRDIKWYIYQTVMPLMQAYGRGIRSADDYCVTYILDEAFEGLLNDHTDLFNEYFLEAIHDFDWETALKNCKHRNRNSSVKRVKRVRRIPRVKSEAK